MAKVNGLPASIRSGIPKLPDTPVGWERVKLKKYLFEVKRPVDLEPNRTYRLVTVKRSRGGVEERCHLLGSEIKTPSQFLVEAGDFLISKRQIVHGACGIVPFDLAGSVVSNEYTVIGTTGGVDLNFLRYLSESMYFQQTCFHSSIGVHVEKMIFSVDRWLNWHFNIPPVVEQKNIVRILYAWDNAIEIAENLIRNSKQQKQALTQNLLIDKNDKWKSVRLSDVAEIIVSNVDKKSDSDEKPVMLCNYTDVYHNQYITQTMCFMEATASEGEIKKFGLKKGDVLITKDSERADDIAVAACVRDNIEGVLCGYHLAIVRPKKNKVDGVFLNSLFSIDRVRYHFASRANGVTRFGLSIGAIKEAAFSIPSFEEQRKISKIILAADDEITAQQKWLDALKLEKQSLMLQLLTGKRRVKVDDSLIDKAVA